MLKKFATIVTVSVLGSATMTFAQTNPERSREMNNTQTEQSPIQIQQGQFFQFAIPTGWKVVEEGQHAVVLCSPDSSAITMMVGNTGLQPGSDPARFVWDKLSVLRNPTLRMGQAQPAKPMQGYAAAWSFEYVYQGANGVPCRGIATCSVRDWYGGRDMVMTAAASQEAQWGTYANWLPQLAMQAAPMNGAAMGGRDVAGQNLRNSIAEGEHARQVREYAARQQAEVARQRDESNNRRNQEFRDTLGNATPYYNPYTGQVTELSSNNASYWINPYTGEIVGDESLSFDPRTPTDPNWQRMQPSPRR